MPCFHPLAAIQGPQRHVKTGKPIITVIGGVARLIAEDRYPEGCIHISCSQCIGCRYTYSTSWAIRAMHEASRWEYNSFITLTYNDENRPADGSLVKHHHQDFIKRLRQWRIREPDLFRTENRHKDYKGIAPIRYYHCGEYGEKFERPHYHTLIFNLEFNDEQIHNEQRGIKLYKSNTLERIWGKGFCSIGAVTFESAAYVARYIMKKQNGKNKTEHYTRENIIGIETELQQEYTTQSRKPGLGQKWYDEYGKEVYPSDFVTLTNKAGVMQRRKPPRYYENLLEKQQPELLKLVKERREAFAENHKDDATPKRLKAREDCKKAAVAICKRNYEEGEGQ